MNVATKNYESFWLRYCIVLTSAGLEKFPQLSTTRLQFWVTQIESEHGKEFQLGVCLSVMSLMYFNKSSTENKHCELTKLLMTYHKSRDDNSTEGGAANDPQIKADITGLLPQI